MTRQRRTNEPDDATLDQMIAEWCAEHREVFRAEGLDNTTVMDFARAALGNTFHFSVDPRQLDAAVVRWRDRQNRPN